MHRGGLRGALSQAGGKEGLVVTFTRAGLMAGWGRGASQRLQSKQRGDSGDSRYK